MRTYKIKSPFFSRKNILIITASLIVFYFVVWGGVFIKNKLDHNHRLRITRAQQVHISKLSPQEQSIRNAQIYLSGSITLVKPTERLILDYLQRKFSLDSTLGVAGSSFDLSENPKTYPQEIHFLARIAYPDRLVKVPPKSLVDGATLTNIYSANCDHLALPDNYWQTIDQNKLAGGYYLTHIALALAFMKDNGCNIPAAQDGLKDTVVQGMVNLADDPQTTADLRYEAIAFLFLSNRNDLVKAKWLDQIVTEQHKDGSWVTVASNDKPDTHATILALWALLEFSRPSTPDQPLIRRPSLTQ